MDSNLLAVSSRLPAWQRRASTSANVTGRAPIFCVVLKDGERWQVEAEWPDGTIEEVHTFKDGLRAVDWVKTQSAAWVAQRVGALGE
jgi:hypothetical protein